MYNIKRVDWYIPGKGATCRLHHLQATHRSDKSKLIHSVERVEDSNKILLLVEKNKKEYVIKWLKMIKLFLHETVNNAVCVDLTHHPSPGTYT